MSSPSIYHDAISSIDEIIEDARNGRMFILVDHEERENEGDLIIPGQMATPDAVNFMATHGRGLICLALTGERIDALGLPLMASNNSSRHETNFTVSIEAKEGVTTGISAHDRARSVAVAIDPRSSGADINTPGHVFPLRAQDGGVLVRAGHTEAAVDISRLAGLNPSGMICEVMNEDGTMARLPDLVAFAQKHALKIGTISDLIAYRLRHDSLVRETAKPRSVTSEYGGDWLLRVFSDDKGDTEHLVLTKGDISTPDPVLVRMHAVNPLDDLLGLRPGKSSELSSAMKVIADEGRGAVVLLRDMSMRVDLDSGASPQTLRQYGLGAQILGALGIHEMILVTDSPKPKIVALDGYELSICGTRRITQETT